MCPSICLSNIRFFSHQSVCLSVRLSVRPSVRPSIRPSVNSPVYPSVRPSVHLFVCHSIFHPSVLPSVCLSSCLSICLSIRPSSCFFVRPYVRRLSDCLRRPVPLFCSLLDTAPKQGTLTKVEG